MTHPSTGRLAPATGRSVELRRLLDGGHIHSIYQPIVALPAAGVVGFEALARGPVGSPLEAPDALFAAAADSGLLVELEWACRAAAFRGARDQLPDGAALFINVEPRSLIVAEPAWLATLADEAVARAPVVLELTERALGESPSQTLEAVHALRRRGFAIALDDVGVDATSIALLPFLQPEVIKLDLSLLASDEPEQDVASVVHAVTAAAERAHAAVVAEGIETDGQQHIAQALGAQYGQGWKFGRPSPLPTTRPSLANLRTQKRDVSDPDGGQATPYEVVAERIAPRIAAKSVLLSIAKYLEHYVAEASFASVLLATFQHEHNFTPRTQARYQTLGAAASFVGVFASDMPRQPVGGVRGAALQLDEPLVLEWDVAVVTPHIAGALVARDLGDQDCRDQDRRFEYCLTYDRDLAVQAARILMGRITRSDEDHRKADPMHDGGLLRYTS